MHTTSTTDRGYNGWTNRETWLVNLWLSNDEGTYREVLDAARDALDTPLPRVTLADWLREFVELQVTECCGTRYGFVEDLAFTAAGSVDWFEVADGWLHDASECAS